MIFIASAIFFGGLTLLNKLFFIFAWSATALLDAMLPGETDAFKKHDLLVRRLRAHLTALVKLVAGLAVVAGISLLPLVLYFELSGAEWSSVRWASPLAQLCMLAGSLVLFIPGRKERSVYPKWSKLLHRILLDNRQIAVAMFRLERRLFRKKAAYRREDFVIVSGLARSGTTVLTGLLFDSGKFHTLTYANMPLVLCPNIWSKFYRPSEKALEERSHGDGLKIGLTSIEALEEFFFRAQLYDRYDTEDGLVEHDLDSRVYRDYLDYQGLLRDNQKEETVYLAKNNNMILRYRSLRSFNPEFKVLIPFRSPLDHARSLMEQHRRFSELQGADPFVLEYMNWLAHREFGLGHRVFRFHTDSRYAPANYPTDTAEHWLAVWISYYEHVLQLLPDKNLILIDFNDIVRDPRGLLRLISKRIGIDVRRPASLPYQRTRAAKPFIVDEGMEREANRVYRELLAVCHASGACSGR